MVDNSFFEERTDESKVKAEIISKYFWAWAKVIIPSVKQYSKSKKLAYIDLFAGPGRYNDSSKSTPLLVLEKAINDKDMREMLVTVFNDKNEDNSKSLLTEIEQLQGIADLKFKPQVHNDEIGPAIVEQFQEMRLVPSLFFIDPWGYKGLSLKLINAVIKDWGCDCVFFFNYNRINMGINNEKVEEHIEALFGEKSAEGLRELIKELNPYERELLIIEKLTESLKEMGAKFVLPFGFKNEAGNRTKQHLIFITKHFRGYEIMKGIMAGYSTTHDQGVPSLVFNPADERFPSLFELSRPLDDLADLLVEDFAGQTLTMGEIYCNHSVGKPYIESNYKEILKTLESDGKIIANPPKEKRRKNTFANKTMVTFPEN